MNVLKLFHVDNYDIARNVLEIRVRAGSYICLYILVDNNIKIKYISNTYQLVDNDDNLDFRKLLTVDKKYMKDLVSTLMNNSLNAYMNELTNGFITLDGGIRCGVSGRGIIKDASLLGFSSIDSLCIRFGKNIFGASRPILNFVSCKNDIRNVLIVSPPMCGKTTIIRDLALMISSGKCGHAKNVGIVDERFEIYPDTMRNNPNAFIDVISGIDKKKGTEFLIRAMRPDVIVLDELGYDNDVNVLKLMISSGVSFIATMHGRCLNDVKIRFENDISMIDAVIILKRKDDERLFIDSGVLISGSFCDFLIIRKEEFYD